MVYKFTKMHGAGNDYVYINCFEEKVDDPCAVSIAFVALKLRAQCSFCTAARTFDIGCISRHIIFDAEIKAAAGDLLYFFFVQFI